MMEYAKTEYTTLAQWGNSRATRIPSSIVKKLALELNQRFSVTVEGDAIVLTPEKTQPTTIHELFEGWSEEQVDSHELDWGPSQGEELSWE